MFGGILGRKLPSMERCLRGDAAGTAQKAPGPDEKDPHSAAPASANGAALAVTAYPQQPQPQQQQQQQQQQQLWLEQQRLEQLRLREMIREEMHGSSPTAARPMQIIINNHSEANTQQRTMNVQQQAPPERKEPRKQKAPLELSPLSRVCLFSAVGLGLYVMHGQLQHKWRMAEMQRRIDSNLFLRVTQIFASAPAPR